jgi:CheY-like chemotaxis protein
MAVAQMAPITISSNGQELQRIESKTFMNVLVIEDYEKTRNNIEQRLMEFGCSVDAVDSPKKAASLIEKDKYQLLIVDIRFDGPNISGDEFVRKNFNALANGKRVAFTGYEEDISLSNRPLFDEIFDKGGVGEPLYEYTQQIYIERRDFIAKEMKDSISGSNKNIADSEWETAEIKILDSLNRTKDKSEKIVWYKGNNLSTNELIQEVKDRDSEIGKSHIRMMLNWINRKK